ncbi:unnamed protein product [Dracunculus medinensis]|uniref:Restriction endonuclease subunit S n=1 Tax=Dracunculus medinensis TaxID=318479 RepID=A0A0N4UKZ9_DRAME|nr:unnamed protein product [Dracunculus medinensis]
MSLELENGLSNGWLIPISKVTFSSTYIPEYP